MFILPFNQSLIAIAPTCVQTGGGYARAEFNTLRLTTQYIVNNLWCIPPYGGQVTGQLPCTPPRTGYIVGYRGCTPSRTGQSTGYTGLIPPRTPHIFGYRRCTPWYGGPIFGHLPSTYPHFRHVFSKTYFLTIKIHQNATYLSPTEQF